MGEESISRRSGKRRRNRRAPEEMGKWTKKSKIPRAGSGVRSRRAVLRCFWIFSLSVSCPTHPSTREDIWIFYGDVPGNGSDGRTPSLRAFRRFFEEKSAICGYHGDLEYGYDMDYFVKFLQLKFIFLLNLKLKLKNTQDITRGTLVPVDRCFENS